MINLQTDFQLSICIFFIIWGWRYATGFR